MRPRGEIREALRELFPLEGEGMATWSDALRALGAQQMVNPLAPAECRLVQHTVENMRRAGELKAVRPVRVPGSRRPMMGYARNWATEWGGAPAVGSGGAGALAQVVMAWR